MSYRGWFSGTGVVLLLACFLLPACQGSAPSRETVKENSLTISTYTGFSNINPILGDTGVSSRLEELVYDGLVQFNERMEVIPHLAKSWEFSEGGKRWLFFLRTGVKFHDGQELTADDVVFTYNLIRQMGQSRFLSGGSQSVQSVMARGRYTVEIVLKNPSPSFLNNLDVGILPKHLWEHEDIKSSKWNQQPVGTGSYRLVSWTDQEIMLEANKDYFLGPPHLQKIRVKSFPNKEAAWAGLMSGEVDFFDLADPKGLRFMEQTDEIQVFKTLKPYLYIILFNLNHPLFQDVEVRQALNLAIDKQKLVDDLLEGIGQVASGSIFPMSWAYKSDLKPYPYNPVQAKKLLTEAGWIDRDGDHILDKDGRPFRFTLFTNQGDDLKNRVSLAIQQNLWEIGIQMSVRSVPTSETGFIDQRQFDAVFLDLYCDRDPDFYSYAYWHSSQKEKGRNFAEYDDPQVDRLLKIGHSTWDSAIRKKAYEELQIEMQKNPPGIYLFWTDFLIGLRKEFTGAKFTSDGIFKHIREIERGPES